MPRTLSRKRPADTATRRSRRLAQSASDRSESTGSSASVSLDEAFSSEAPTRKRLALTRAQRKRAPAIDPSPKDEDDPEAAAMTTDAFVDSEETKRPAKKRKSKTRALSIRAGVSTTTVNDENNSHDDDRDGDDDEEEDTHGKTVLDPPQPVPPVSPYTLVTNASNESKRSHRSSSSDRHSSESFSPSSSSSSTVSVRTPLPEGVVELYPSSRKSSSSAMSNTFSCRCDENHNAPNNMNETFLRTYGSEYYSHLKASLPNERLAMSPLDEDSCATSSNSSTTHSVTLSASTPPGRVHVSHAQRSVGSPSSGTSSDMGDVDGEAPTIDKQPELTTKMRAILVDWLIELSVEYELHQNTVHLAVALVDKALDCGVSDEDYLYPTQETTDSNESTERFLVTRDMFQCLGW